MRSLSQACVSILPGGFRTEDPLFRPKPLATGASALRHDRLDLLSRVRRPLVLPNPDHGPAKVFERDIGLLVTPAVGRDLLAPPSGVRFGCNAMVRASMPEAPVDEDSDAGTREHNVDSPSREPGYGLIDTKTQTTLVQQRAHPHLGRGVSAPHLAEVCADLRG
jgi:hypothetical protein